MTARPALLGALGTLLLLAATARAEDAQKAKVTFRTHWKAGDVVTRTVEETETESVKVVGADGKAFSDETKTTETSVVYVLKCVEADGAGHMTKGIAHFSEFAIVLGKDRDESLKGRAYELSGVGKDRKVSPVEGGKSESDAAMSWLSKNLGVDQHGDEMDDILSPKNEVAAGDVVEIPMKAVADIVGKVVPLDVEKSAGKVTMEAVGADVTWAFDMALETKGLPSPQTGQLMPWGEGGKMTIKGRRTQKPDGAAAPYDSTSEFEWAGTTADQGGVKVVVKFTNKKTHKAVAGGEIPKPPERPAPDPPAPDKPAPDKPAPDKPAPDKPEPEKPAPDQPK